MVKLLPLSPLPSFLDEVTVPPVPRSPLRAVGLPWEGAVLVSDEVEPVPWWGLEFEMGRRRYDAPFSAARHAPAELCVPIERALGPLKSWRRRPVKVAGLSLVRGPPVWR